MPRTDRFLLSKLEPRQATKRDPGFTSFPDAREIRVIAIRDTRDFRREKGPLSGVIRPIISRNVPRVFLCFPIDREKVPYVETPKKKVTQWIWKDRGRIL